MNAPEVVLSGRVGVPGLVTKAYIDERVITAPGGSAADLTPGRPRDGSVARVKERQGDRG
jgi:hypothetical protein